MVIGSPLRINCPFPSFERRASLQLLTYPQENNHFLLTISCDIHVFYNWTRSTGSEGYFTHAMQRHHIESFHNHDIQNGPFSHSNQPFTLISTQLVPSSPFLFFSPNLKAPLSFRNYILPRLLKHQLCTVLEWLLSSPSRFFRPLSTSPPAKWQAPRPLAP